MSRPAELHGILVVDKPAGWTSHDVVARVRRLAGQRQVGHGGTLDPLATGVLPLGLGKGTRLLEYVSAGGKSYTATLRLGTATATYDADGAVTGEAPWQHISRTTFENALHGFLGSFDQRPPPYSAIKRQGEPLYQKARRGEVVEVAARRVTIQALDLQDFSPPVATLHVRCGSGTYVRSLAHDLGLALDSAAHLTALRRTSTGMLTLDEAVPWAGLNADGRLGIEDHLLALDRPVWLLPAMILAEAHAEDVLQGRPLSFDGDDDALCRAYDTIGTFLALVRYDATRRLWQPHKVFGVRAGQGRSADGDNSHACSGSP